MSSPSLFFWQNKNIRGVNYIHRTLQEHQGRGNQNARRNEGVVVRAFLYQRPDTVTNKTNPPVTGPGQCRPSLCLWSWSRAVTRVRESHDCALKPTKLAHHPRDGCCFLIQNASHVVGFFFGKRMGKTRRLAVSLIGDYPSEN